MSEKEAVQEVIEIAAHNMDWFIGIIGVVFAFFAFFQWHFSQRQLQQMKEATKLELINQFHLNDLEEHAKTIKELNTQIKQLQESVSEQKSFIRQQGYNLVQSIQDEVVKLTDQDPFKASQAANETIRQIEAFEANKELPPIIKALVIAMIHDNLKRLINTGSESVKRVFDYIEKNCKPYLDLHDQMESNPLGQKE